MKRLSQMVFVVLIALAFGNAGIGGEEMDAQKKIARIQELLSEGPVIDTVGFPEEMPLSKLLAAVRRQLPGDKKIALRLEETELGKEACRLAEAPVRCSGLRTTLSTILRKALRQVTKDEELAFGIREDGIVITRAPRAVHSMVYDAGDIVRAMPLLLPSLKHVDVELFAGVKSSDGMALLVRYLMIDIPLRPWEKIEIENGHRLSVRASYDTHEGIADTLKALRRTNDTAVIMNARLYEVDREFFRKHVAPLFAGDKEASERSRIVSLQDELFKKIVRHQLILQSAERKLRPNEKALFLSRHSVFCYNAGRNAEGGLRTGTGLDGVSFEVRPIVSADRRYLRLHVTQHFAQLVKIDKSKMLDPATGKDVDIESPNVRKSTVTGSIQIPDAGAILMPVSYRPAGDDRVWLLVARPYIWIEEEEKERGPKGQTTSKGIWESEVPKEEAPPAAVPPAGKPLSLDDDGKAILQSVVTDILTNPELADTRKFYGTAADRTVALVDGDKLSWPKEFQVNLHGYKARTPVRLDPFQEQRRVLGIRLDKFDLKEKKSDPFEGPIEVCLFNAGGSANGAVIGGCSVYYQPQRAGKRWTVKLLGFRDP
jgi:hypothetical protein